MPTMKDCRCVGNYCYCSGKPVLKDALPQSITVNIPLMMKDGAPAAHVLQDAVDTLVKDAKYDPYRGHFNDNGVPLDRHMAMMDLELDSAAAWRAMAYRDAMIDDTTGRNFNLLVVF